MYESAEPTMKTLTFGFQELLSRVHALPGAMDRAKSGWLKDSALIVEKAAKENIVCGRDEWPPLAASTVAARRARKSYSKKALLESIKPLYETGRMMRSITHEVEDEAAYIGWTVPYGSVHEFGTTSAGPTRSTTIPARPHMVPAAEENLDRMRSALVKRIKSETRLT